MGYSHGYTFTPDDADFKATFGRFLLDAERLTAAACTAGGFQVAGWDDEHQMFHPDAPLVNEGTLMFNGWPTNVAGHEPLNIAARPVRLVGDDDRMNVLTGLFDLPEHAWMSFVKTNRNAYDLAVMAVLLRAAETVATFNVTSDGRWDVEWKPARDLHLTVYGTEASKPALMT